jgi:hypothetical protein
VTPEGTSLELNFVVSDLMDRTLLPLELGRVQQLSKLAANTGDVPEIARFAWYAVGEY